MKYCIYYITTGSYVNYADTFFNSLVNFMPSSEKKVIWLSDAFYDYSIPNVEIVKVPILDMPWPLVTLLKMHYIFNNKIEGYDGYFYFNGNSKILKMDDDTILLINDALKNNQFICTKHTCDLNRLNYKQASFFGGNQEVFFDICEKVVDLIDLELRKNYLFGWHDETALNLILDTVRSEDLCFHQFGLNIIHNKCIKEYKYVFILLDSDKHKKCKL